MAAFEVAISIGLDFAKYITKEPPYQFKIDYAVKDTLVCSITNIPDEKTAKKISRVVATNKELKKFETVFVTYSWLGEERTFKY